MEGRDLQGIFLSREQCEREARQETGWALGVRTGMEELGGEKKTEPMSGCV